MRPTIESLTKAARDLLKGLNKHLGELYEKQSVVYADTDSVYYSENTVPDKKETEGPDKKEIEGFTAEL